MGSHVTSDATCPVARSLDVLGDRWALLIIRDAFDGITRFGDFQRSLGVAKNILSSRLRGLVDADIFAVVPASDGSAYHEYVLTDRGRDVFPVIVSLRQWGTGHAFEAGEPRTRLVDRERGEPVALLQVRDAAGRAMLPGDAVVVAP